MDKDKINNIITSKLSDFCQNSCNAFCCNTGKLILESTQDISTILAVAPNDPRMIGRADGFYELILKNGCPCLDGSSCGIYPRRPNVCKEFPTFVRAKSIFVASWCPAVKKGMLDDYLDSLKKDGWKIILQ